MQVEYSFFDSVVPEGNRECSCTVCYGYSNESAVHGVDAIHEICNDLFTDDLEGTDPGECLSLLKESNNRDLEELEEFGETVGLEPVDDNIIIRNPISSSDKFRIAFTGLMVLFLIIFISFAVLVHKGVVHVPGMNPEALKNITRFIGVGLCVISSGYSLLVLGCIVGECAESNYRSGSVLGSCESITGKSAIIKRKLNNGLYRCSRALRLRAPDSRLPITIPMLAFIVLLYSYLIYLS